MTAIGSRGVLMWGHSREGERMRPRLRLFTVDDDAEGGTALAEPTVSISFGEFSRIVSDARRFDRTFLSDFEDDTVQVPEDLYEVLTAYWRLRPGA
jgi:hypothetical protein